MPTNATPTVSNYIAAQPPAARAVLKQVRAVLRRALPGAEETISYGIPGYRLHERVVIYFAGWKAHWALYPVTGVVRASLGDALKRYTVSKGTIRFPLDAPVPAALVARVAKLRAKEEAARRATARPARTRPKGRAKAGG
ncbi:MAG: DUF1801 domain-containing protein [Vicinamibacterales bacterium]